MLNTAIKKYLDSIYLRVVVPVLLTVLLFAVTIQIVVLPTFGRHMMARKRELIKELVNNVCSLISEYEEDVQAGRLSLEEAQQRAIGRIGELRYGPEEKDYYWINDMTPRVVMHPYREDLVGQDVSHYQDLNGKELFSAFVDTVKLEGSGYVDYMWQWKDDSTRVVPKISYVRGFEPWGWIIGTGIYIEDVHVEIEDMRTKLIVMCSGILAVMLLLSGYVIAQGIKVEKQRRHAQETFENTKNFLDGVIRSMPSMLIGVDKDEKITHWNHEAEKVTGMDSSAALGRDFDDALPDYSDEVEKIDKAIKEGRVYKHGKVEKIVASQTKYYDVNIFPLIQGEIKGAVIRIDDITERVHIEEMMIQSEKMMSVGGLAAGMAHEINNPLAGILQNIQVIRNRMTSPLPNNIQVAESCGTSMDVLQQYMEQRGLNRMIDNVINSGRRAAKIVDNMLSFSRMSDARFAEYDLRELMDKAVELAGNDYDLKKKYDFRHITIHREYHEDMPKVRCESTQIQQVLLNLLKNGAHAMINDLGDEDHGGNGKSPTFYLRIRMNNHRARIEIEDNGMGMEEEVRWRVFEPFFTTKAVGVGTGLGLSVSYFIITENHKGTLSVESIPQQGTKFIIELPLGE